MCQAERDIQRIMNTAFTAAANVLDAEVRKMLTDEPAHYSRFVLAVGWGPSLFRADGTLAKREQLKGRAAKVMRLADRFYDAYGADNREVRP